MVKSRNILKDWIKRPAVIIFTGLIIIIVFSGEYLTQGEINFSNLVFIKDVLPELIGVFSALIFSYYWETTARNLEWDENWERNYLNILMELEGNKNRLEIIARGGKELLKTTSWEIYRYDLKGGSSPLVPLVSEIYYHMNALNISFTYEDGSELVREPKQYATYCLKQIFEYHRILNVWYGEDKVKGHLERYSDYRVHNY